MVASRQPQTSGLVGSPRKVTAEFSQAQAGCPVPGLVSSGDDQDTHTSSKSWPEPEGAGSTKQGMGF